MEPERYAWSPDAQYVHIATRGTTNANAPTFNGLAPWPDSEGNWKLAVHELLGLNFRGLELVNPAASLRLWCCSVSTRSSALFGQSRV
jgi:hypothetical protein